MTAVHIIMKGQAIMAAAIMPAAASSMTVADIIGIGIIIAAMLATVTSIALRSHRGVLHKWSLPIRERCRSSIAVTRVGGRIAKPSYCPTPDIPTIKDLTFPCCAAVLLVAPATFVRRWTFRSGGKVLPFGQHG